MVDDRPKYQGAFTASLGLSFGTPTGIVGTGATNAWNEPRLTVSKGRAPDGERINIAETVRFSVGLLGFLDVLWGL